MQKERRIRIGAVHALLNSIAPTDGALSRQWPSADVAHLLDGSLYLDRSRGTADDAELAARISHLIEYSAATGAEGILFTGSFFGAAVKQARDRVDIPVLTSFDGIVDRALALRRPLHVISTAADSVTLLQAELEREAARRATPVAVSGGTVSGALDALLASNAARHDQLIIDAVRDTDAGTAIVFAQFSMERALRAASSVTTSPVIGPASEGVARLRGMLVHGQ